MKLFEASYHILKIASMLIFAVTLVPVVMISATAMHFKYMAKDINAEINSTIKAVTEG
jgi:hypothetical protein